jgi:hypothetical protein
MASKTISYLVVLTIYLAVNIALVIKETRVPRKKLITYVDAAIGERNQLYETSSNLFRAIFEIFLIPVMRWIVCFLICLLLWPESSNVQPLNPPPHWAILIFKGISFVAVLFIVFIPAIRIFKYIKSKRG